MTHVGFSAPIMPTFFGIPSMWFKNLQLYRLNKDKPLGEAAQVEALLTQFVLSPCSASDPQSLGWVAPTASGSLVHAINRQWLLALGVEKRLLPASVVKQFANDRAKLIEEAEGRRVGRKEMRDLREALQAELMPRAFVQRRTTFAWIDPANGWLVIDAAAPAKSDELLEHLHKSIDGFGGRLPTTQISPLSAMTSWVADGEAPAGFTIDQDLELRSPDNAIVRYAKHTLEGDEVRQHIAQGKVVTRLALTWRDKISFVLNDKLQIKRLAFLDILKEETDGQAQNEDERFDLDFTLMTGEVAQLIAELMEALGGEASA